MFKRLIDWWTEHHTADTHVAGIWKIVKKLEAHAERRRAQVDAHRVKADRLLDLADAKSADAARSARMAANFTGMVS